MCDVSKNSAPGPQPVQVNVVSPLTSCSQRVSYGATGEDRLPSAQVDGRGKVFHCLLSLSLCVHVRVSAAAGEACRSPWVRVSRVP